MNTKQPCSLSMLAVLTYLALIVLLILALIIPLRWLMADLSISVVRRDIESWNLNEANPSLTAWNKTYAELERAISFNPDQGDYYSLKGLLHEWHNVINSGLSNNETPGNTQQEALNAYRRSIVLRPAWPDAWANLARQKAIVNQLDDEFLTALDRALTLGSQEPRIQLLVTDITTLVWPFPPSERELRSKALRNIQRAFGPSGNIQQNIDFVQSRGLLEDICPFLNKALMGPRAQQACAQTTPFNYILLP